MRGILGSRKNTSSTYGQEMDRSNKEIKKVLKENNEQQMMYVLSIAALKAEGKDLSITTLKKLLNKARLKEEVVLKKMRLVTLYLNSLMPEEAQRFIEKFGRSWKEIKCNFTIIKIPAIASFHLSCGVDIFYMFAIL